MRKKVFAAIGLIALVLVIIVGAFVYGRMRGIAPAILPPAGDIAELVASGNANTADVPLTVPPGFSLSIFAKNISGARVMALDASGNIWVSRTNDGIVTELVVKDGAVAEQRDIFRNLNHPHGLAFDPGDPATLYIAEEDKIVRAHLSSDAPLETVIDLPSGGNHITRTIRFGPDGRLYVSIGSSCNVCRETDERRAKMYSLNRDGSDWREEARGLRNSVFFAWSPVDGRLWATEMGRDLLGDDTPPDEINVIERGKNYGWPICYGNNIHDDAFDKNTYIRNPCMEPFEMPSTIDVPAHSAPLGLAFIPEEGWAEPYWYNLLVAYHGSWNRSVPAGYKIVRYRMDAKGTVLGTEDFVTGWLPDAAAAQALGRPVDILAVPGGIAYVSDDKAGVVYRIAYRGTDTADMVRLRTPAPNAVVSSPLSVQGEARGNWFFEASFPVKLLDGNGREIAVRPAQAEGEWMTTSFVPFAVSLEFDTPDTATGTLVLKKDNPSGLPEYDAEVRVPVRFSPAL
jgi:glucose/arabinose dehydrogenase